MTDAPPLDFGAPPADVPPSDDSLACEVCGTPLVYAGRGRKPKRCEEHKTSSTSSSARTSSRGSVPDRELQQACDNLRQMYDELCAPLALVSPQAAGVWADRIDTLDKRNRVNLRNNRTLVKKINSTSERGGTLLFALSHVFAVAPVVMVLYVQASQIRQARAQAADAYEPPPYDYDIPGAPIDPDAPFRGMTG